MKKSIIARIIIVTTFVLILGTTSAYALTSTATVNKGSSTRVYGVNQMLSSKALNGTVVSYSSSSGTADQRLNGYIITRGAIWIHTRDSASVSPGCSASLY